MKSYQCWSCTKESSCPPRVEKKRTEAVTVKGDQACGRRCFTFKNFNSLYQHFQSIHPQEKSILSILKADVKDELQKRWWKNVSYDDEFISILYKPQNVETHQFNHSELCHMLLQPRLDSNLKGEGHIPLALPKAAHRLDKVRVVLENAYLALSRGLGLGFMEMLMSFC